MSFDSSFRRTKYYVVKKGEIVEKELNVSEFILSDRTTEQMDGQGKLRNIGNIKDKGRGRYSVKFFMSLCS